MFFLRNYCNSTLLWPTWIKLNLMTYELNDDRLTIGIISHDIGMKSGSNWISWPRFFMLTDFTPNWALFSIFVISFDRGIKLGSNWNSWPMNLMLTDLTPNWALFLFFVISHDRHMEHGWNLILWPSNLMLTDFTPNWAFFLCSLFHILERWKLDQIESHDLWI